MVMLEVRRRLLGAGAICGDYLLILCRLWSALEVIETGEKKSYEREMWTTGDKYPRARKSMLCSASGVCSKDEDCAG